MSDYNINKIVKTRCTAPCFDYCSSLWGNCYAYLKEKFQNRAAEIIIANANYEITSADVLDSPGWETLEERLNRNKLVY